MAHDVFISYSAQDKPIADAVYAALEARQIRCWIAPRDVLPGQDYAEALIDAINESRAMTLVLSSNSNNSPHVMREVERAASKGIPILPLRIEDVTPSKSMEYFISRTHWLDALTPPLEKHLERLAETLGLLLSGDERSHRVGGGGGELEAPASMEQHIRFCTSSDGVRIAYATVGQGPPLVRIAGWLTHLEFEWENPLWRSFIDALSRRFLLIRYDGRGMGLSDREVKDLSPEAQVLDLEAVLDALGFDRVALYGLSQGGATAIAYAVRRPERVTHLILYGSFARMFWVLDTQEGRQAFEAMLTLIRQGWGRNVPVYRQLFTSLFMPDADAEAARQLNELQRVSTSGENAAAWLSAAAKTDVRHLLSQIATPTLVIHRRGDSMVPFEAGRELASSIPGARFLPLEGRNHFPVPNEPTIEAGSKAIEEFVGVSERSEAVAAPSGLLTILFTDMEGSTTLTQRLGDARAQEILRTHNSIVRDALKTHGGSEVKHTGDGIMASFPFASRALECAVSVQRAFAAHNQENPDTPIRVRMGLNAGEPVAEDEDLFGTAVQVAARICAHAEPCQILASNVVQELAAGKGFAFSDQGEAALKGLEKPVHLYEVRWQD